MLNKDAIVIVLSGVMKSRPYCEGGIRRYTETQVEAQRSRKTYRKTLAYMGIRPIDTACRHTVRKTQKTGLILSMTSRYTRKHIYT